MGRFFTDFRVGVFVLVALAVGGALLVTLGPGLNSRQTIPLETYIEESVQGLDVGSPVKQRGVQIGKVASIGFVRAAYEIPVDSPLRDRLSRLILVRVNIDTSILRGQSFVESEAELARLIDDGLRVRLASQGITGQAYLEVDFVSPKRNPPIPIPWKPGALYIPSSASTISRLTTAAETVVNNLQQADIARMIREGTKLLDEVRETNENIRQLVSGPQIAALESDAVATLGGARKLIETLGPDLKATVESLRATAKRVEDATNGGVLTRTLANVEQISKSGKAATGDLPDLMDTLRHTVKRLDYIVTSGQGDIASTLDDLTAVAANLRELTNNAKSYPAQILFGSPPPGGQAQAGARK